MSQIKTLHFKVKPESYSWLNQAAVEVNQVWNYCNEVSMKALEPGTERPNGKWLSGFDLCKLTAGMTEYLPHINSNTINQVCNEYGLKRKQTKKRSLKWRHSFGPRKNLGWVPIKSASFSVRNGRIKFCGKIFRIYETERLLSYGKYRAGTFSQNSLGEWFLNISVEIPACEIKPTGHAVGIDLGLKTIATVSDGSKLEASNFYRRIESKIAMAQRRGHKKQSKRLHLKAKNQRADALHKFSRKVVDENDLIVIGDVSSSKLAKTRMAKSVHDAGWFMLKTMLQYKGNYAGRRVEIVNEAYTTRACSSCGCLTGPSGLRQLAVRVWTCSECGTEHDRDINSAKNILALRYERPLAGTRAIP